MSQILSDRAARTDQVIVLPSALEDPTKGPPGMYRIILLAICVSIFIFFAALVTAYWWREQEHTYWTAVQLPRILWLSTALILVASATFEIARYLFRHGNWRAANHVLLVTASLGAGFLASQLTAWRDLADQGVFLSQNPHSTFFYLFTGLHAIHLIGGLIALFVLVLSHSKKREKVDVVAFYWHFLAVLWIALFAVLSLS